MHPEARQYIAQWTRNRTFSNVLEFGSLDINGSVRDLFTLAGRWGEYHGIDLQRGPGVDEVVSAVNYLRTTSDGDGEEYLAPANADVVVCCEVLEHSPDVPGIIDSAFVNLRPGGLFLVTCATDPREPHSAVDGGPLRGGEHYGNVDPATLITACAGAGFVVQQHEIARDRGDLYLRAKKP